MIDNKLYKISDHFFFFFFPSYQSQSTTMTTLKKLNFITGNKNKLAEVRTIIGNVIEVDNQAVEVPEIQGTIEEIAKEKCRRATEAVCSL